jgi:hypothetical protein
MAKKILLLLIIFIAVQTISVKAQEEKYISLFIYNFTKHFEWPESIKAGNFVIQVLGHKSVFYELKEFTAAKKVGNQNISVRGVSNISQIGKCHIMFIGHWQSRYLPEVLNKLSNHPTLIITEKEGLLDLGSAINFVITGGTIQFEIKKSNALRNGLKMDPQLMKMAVRIVD